MAACSVIVINWQIATCNIQHAIVSQFDGFILFVKHFAPHVWRQMNETKWNLLEIYVGKIIVSVCWIGLNMQF